MTIDKDQVSILVLPTLKEILANKLIPIKNYLPAYAGESAGFDLYNAGEDTLIHPVDDNFIPAKTRQRNLIPTGIKIAVPQGFVALIRERGSITKTPLVARAGVIDSGYTGEVFVNMINTSHEIVKIYAGEKLPVQIVVVPINTRFVHVSESDFTNNITANSRRREGKMGSSD